jgi:hypothetical protein
MVIRPLARPDVEPDRPGAALCRQSLVYLYGSGWIQGGLEINHGAYGKLVAALGQALVTDCEPASAAQLPTLSSKDQGRVIVAMRRHAPSSPAPHRHLAGER